jgi:transcription elongation factor GreA
VSHRGAHEGEGGFAPDSGPGNGHDAGRETLSRRLVSEKSRLNNKEFELERVPITRKGYESLKKELEQLKTVERPQNIRAIEEARAHGDLSENAEFEAAKERQAFLEARISELSFKLNNADIIDPDRLPKDKAVFASTVLLENIDTEENVEYQLVGPDESDINRGRISVSSPLGRAILGKRPGDEIVLAAPGGKRCYELIEIL